MPKCWTQFGDDTLIGEDPINDGGRSVAYSTDGKHVAVTSHVGVGTVRVYSLEKSSGSFAQLGADIENDSGGAGADQKTTRSHLQRTEALVSSDGSVVAVTSHTLDGADSGGLTARVFGYDDVSDSWVRRGDEIARTYYETVAMSSDGNLLAFGSKTGFGFPLVYFYDGGSWSNVEFHADCMNINLMRDLQST